MDSAVVKRVKRSWGVAWACVTGLALLGWGVKVAAVAAVAFLGVSILAITGFFLYVLLGDVPVAWRVFLIALFLVGLVVELGAFVAVFEWLLISL